MMLTRLAACRSALLARSSASVSVCPLTDAIIAQVPPFYFKSKIKFKRLNNDDYLISRMHVSSVGQKQRECLGVTFIWGFHCTSPSILFQKKNKIETVESWSNYDDYSISCMHVSFIGQKQRKCLGVTTVWSPHCTSQSILFQKKNKIETVESWWLLYQSHARQLCWP
jgi:hypothetical protein